MHFRVFLKVKVQNGIFLRGGGGEGRRGGGQRGQA